LSDIRLEPTGSSDHERAALPPARRVPGAAQVPGE
jgi:hypothetical protein